MTDTGWSYPGASTYRATVQDLIDKKLAQYAADHFDLKPFMGDEKSKAPIVKKTQFTKEAGDKITIAMQGYLKSRPVPAAEYDYLFKAEVPTARPERENLAVSER